MRHTGSIALPTADGQILRGKISDTPGAAPVLVFAHGLGSTRAGEKAVALAAECERRGWAFAAFDFRGHGESDGTMRELRGARLLEDLDAITRCVKERGHETIYLVGSSMGGWVTAWFAALHPERVRACVLLAPALRFLEGHHLSETQREQGRQSGRYRVTNQWIDLELDFGLYAESADYPLAQLTQRLQTPTLLVHGLQDEIIPYTGSLEFIEQCRALEVQLLLLKNGDHRLNAQKDWLARTVGDFCAMHR